MAEFPADAIERRPTDGLARRIDVALLGAIPDDAAAQLALGKRYVVMAIEDPDAPGEWIAGWGLLTADAGAETLVGWGYNYGNNFGGDP